VTAANQQGVPWHCEQLDILQLLGIRFGIIALSKCDLAPEEQAATIKAEVRQLVRGTFLADAPVVRASARSSQGINELLAALHSLCRQIPTPVDGPWFRLPVDRAFNVRPSGVVVTGSILSGVVRIEDELELQPGGQRVKVRAIQNHNRNVEEARRGQRAALQLEGATVEQVRRGQELGMFGFLIPSRILTVKLRGLASASNRPRHNAQVHCHLGTAATTGLLSLLDIDELPPDGQGLAQLLLREPVVAVWGQDFVLRDLLTGDPVGGGKVVQPVARKVRRRHIKAMDRLESLTHEDEVIRALAFCWLCGNEGVTQAALVRGAGLSTDRASQLLDYFRSRGDLLVVGRTPDDKEILAHAEIARVISHCQRLSPLLRPPGATGITVH
jgi:selenocysteine-specific elongation factor